MHVLQPLNQTQQPLTRVQEAYLSQLPPPNYEAMHARQLLIVHALQPRQAGLLRSARAER